VRRILRAIENLYRCTPVLELHVALKIIYLCDYITILLRTQAVVILNHVNPNIEVCGIGQEKPVTGSKRGVNLSAVRPTAIQLTNCSFGVVK
jgi:hypothetical protein